jgi:hypothetical protein
MSPKDAFAYVSCQRSTEFLGVSLRECGATLSVLQPPLQVLMSVRPRAFFASMQVSYARAPEDGGFHVWQTILGIFEIVLAHVHCPIDGIVLRAKGDYYV